MNTANQAADLNRRFAIADCLSFEEIADGFVVARISTHDATASIALQGAHVMTYQPVGHAPVIWLSKFAQFSPGKSIRGGVPWALVDASLLPDHRVRLEFELVQSDTTRAQWPALSTVRNIITVGPELEVELATSNLGSTAFELGQALHTYFEVGDIRRATVLGLEHCDYIDKFDGGARKVQEGAVSFTQETERIYIGTHGYCEIRDPALARSIVITSTGSRSTVVWNPWSEKAGKMGDFGPDGHLAMVCVETANAAEDVITLAPGATHRMAAQYRSIKH